MQNRLLRILLPVFVIGITLLGCTGTSGVPQTEKPEKTTGSEESPTPQVFKIGDEIKLGDYVITVSKIEDPYKESNQYSQPGDGNRYVAIEVTYQNKTSDKTISYNPLDWKVFDSEGYSYDSGYFGTKEPTLSSGDLNPGGKVKGWLTFEVLNSSKNFKAQFAPGWLSSENAEIVLY